MSDPDPEILELLGERVFDASDQQRFAQASRDFNPIHVDPVAARRLISGRMLVHGMHTLIQALDLWGDVGASSPWSAQCSFVHPVNVGDRVQFVRRPDWRSQQRVAAMVEGVAAMDLVVGTPTAAAPALPVHATPARRLGPLPAPLDEPPENLLGQWLEIEDWAGSLPTHYPSAAERLGPAALGDLARLSFVVGMVCPGLHSVFQTLRFEPAPVPGPLRVMLHRYDPRYRLCFIAFRGAIQGELRAQRRPAPLAQPSARAVAGAVPAGAWSGRRALVVGGSRGLGEITAKLLAGAGADVTITYATGADDARAVAADIGALGRGRCESAALDLSRPFCAPPRLAPGDFDAVFFFATPRIYAKRLATFHRAAFDEFASFYLERFHELCLWLEGGRRPVSVYLPSTAFIGERPRGMTEYAMAKAAAEVLADDLNRSLRHVRILHSRLPRLASDQTALLGPLSVEDNVAALGAVLHAMEAELRRASGSSLPRP